MPVDTWTIYEALIPDPTNPLPNDFSRDKREARAVRVRVTEERTCHIVWREWLRRADQYTTWGTCRRVCVAAYPHQTHPINSRDVAIEHGIGLKTAYRNKFPTWPEDAEEVAA